MHVFVKGLAKFGDEQVGTQLPFSPNWLPEQILTHVLRSGSANVGEGQVS